MFEMKTLARNSDRNKINKGEPATYGLRRACKEKGEKEKDGIHHIYHTYPYDT